MGSDVHMPSRVHSQLNVALGGLPPSGRDDWASAVLSSGAWFYVYRVAAASVATRVWRWGGQARVWRNGMEIVPLPRMALVVSVALAAWKLSFVAWTFTYACLKALLRHVLA